MNRKKRNPTATYEDSHEGLERREKMTNLEMSKALDKWLQENTANGRLIENNVVFNPRSFV